MLRNRGIVQVYLILSAAFSVHFPYAEIYIHFLFACAVFFRFNVSYFAQAFIFIYNILEKCSQLTFNDLSR